MVLVLAETWGLQMKILIIIVKAGINFRNIINKWIERNKTNAVIKFGYINTGSGDFYKLNSTGFIFFILCLKSYYIFINYLNAWNGYSFKKRVI